MVIICAMLCSENIFYRPKLRKDQYLRQNQQGPPQTSQQQQQGQLPWSTNSNLALKSNKYNSFSGGGGGANPSAGIYGPASVNAGPSEQEIEHARTAKRLSMEEEKIELAHSGLRHEYGDFLTYWNIFKNWEKWNFTYEWCERSYINYRSMKTARKIR
jgi:hypothetical protein